MFELLFDRLTSESLFILFSTFSCLLIGIYLIANNGGHLIRQAFVQSHVGYKHVVHLLVGVCLFILPFMLSSYSVKLIY